MSKIICLVDDTIDLLQNFTEFLEMEGYQVWPCKGGKEALERMKHDAPHLIITDLWMPEMDGITLIEHVKNNNRLKEIPIIIFSARPIPDYEEKALSLGVHTFIKKPTDLDDILGILNPFFKP
jgi:CheY-like chemotaxis protein